MTRFALRVLLIWVAVCGAGYFGGHTLVNALLPLLAMVSENASQEFGAALRWDEQEPNMLLLRATCVEATPALNALGVAPGSVITTGTHLEHILVPPVLLLGVVLAWPPGTLRQRALLALLALPSVALTLALTTPFLLIGKIEAMLLERAASLGVTREEPLVVQWMLFAEGGGRWLLPVLLALSCIRLSDWLTRRHND